MKRIKEIKIKNFKAFQEEQNFVIDGKNVLVYGNNGAGKSSLFWALYTILHNSGKTIPEVQKYFKEFDEGNTGTHQ
jgi:AAA15 family ATPase/GTPase